jgi:predicted CopG family antitoxin
MPKPTKIIRIREKTYWRLDRLRGQFRNAKMIPYTFSEVIDRLIDTWNREKLLEEGPPLG